LHVKRNLWVPAFIADTFKCHIVYHRLLHNLKTIFDKHNIKLGGAVPKEQKPCVKDKEEQLAIFEDLFFDKNLAEICFEVLKAIDSPIVTHNNEYALGVRNKSAITAWIEALKEKSYIKNVSRQQLSAILNNKITGLNLGKDGKTLSPQVNASTYKKYYSKIYAALP